MSLVSILAQSSVDYSMYTTQQDSTGSILGGGFMMLVWLAIVAVVLVAQWKIFEKAGEKGWKALIPFYNAYTLFRIAGRNGWGFILLFVPLVNVVVSIIVSLDLAKHFGKSTVFAIFGLVLFPFVGYPMLAFGDATYVGQKHQ